MAYWVVVSLGATPNLWVYENKKKALLVEEKWREKTMHMLVYSTWTLNRELESPLDFISSLAIGSLLIVFLKSILAWSSFEG